MAKAQTRLSKPVVFFSPIIGKRNATGGSKQGWKEEFSTYASVYYLMGGETVMGARMQGKRPAILTMRALNRLNQIRLDWVVNFDGHNYNIRELPRKNNDAGLAEMMVEAKI